MCVVSLFFFFPFIYYFVLFCFYYIFSVIVQDTVGDKALRVVDGAIYVAKAAPLGTAVKVTAGSWA